MADVFSCVAKCAAALGELADDQQRRRALHVLVGGLGALAPVLEELPEPPPAPARSRVQHVEEAPLSRKARSPKGGNRGGETMAAKGARTAEQILSLLRTSKDGMGPAMVSAATKLPAPTAAYWLIRLHREGRLTKTGRQKTVRYHLAEEQ